ncbi:PREDICTED: protein NEGATIVE REGULATOR OF RESISTANCE-like [Nelumbo nucifera]|uniref:Protein NEGATIVE REGULATOR OF RESISTANCE-like n=2 Tax=Nelumbo nucifera TaxID=4432 RepID=A0A1U8Q872_NELNU|nr:PREDICTED: protein NEGATIVE REGULATOR OF RESISTANCE-like [Nelumbo nucifera]DAD31763.1 TPA_asm: hypothetical protein HUJ06_010614 [Nelumbo nucifera]
MESDNRKRQENGEVEFEERRTKAREDNSNGGKQTATESEVEEFYAILRRIHDAVKYFQKKQNNKNGVEGHREKEKAPRWRPEFEWEDFEEVKVREKRGEGVEEENNHMVLDLNADPVSDGNSG